MAPSWCWPNTDHTAHVRNGPPGSPVRHVRRHRHNTYIVRTRRLRGVCSLRSSPMWTLSMWEGGKDSARGH
eukprot:scaffold20587_cov110-Isochrysis_galbana.AAC.2